MAEDGQRLLDAGHAVSGYNRTRAKAGLAIDAGRTLLDTPRAVAEASDVVLSMVTDTDSLRAVALGDDGILAGLPSGSDLHRDEHRQPCLQPGAGR